MNRERQKYVDRQTDRQTECKYKAHDRPEWYLLSTLVTRLWARRCAADEGLGVTSVGAMTHAHMHSL